MSMISIEDHNETVAQLKDQIQNLRKQRDRAEADKIGLIKACDQRAAHEYKLMGENAELKAENERLKAAAKEVVDAESAITYAIIAPSAEKFDEIVEQRKRKLAQTLHALRQQIKEQTK